MDAADTVDSTEMDVANIVVIVAIIVPANVILTTV